MARNIPEQGIEAYMEGEVSRLTPANKAWKLHRWLTESEAVWGFLVMVTIVFLGKESFPKGLEMLVSIAGYGIVLSILLVVFLTFLRREPGEWNRYSLTRFRTQYMAKHAVLAGIRLAVQKVRQLEREAEFEVAVLEQGKNAFGFILVQTAASAMPGSVFKDSPIQIFTEEGNTAQFGETYVPVGAI